MGGIAAQRLRVEYKTNPLGLDETAPRLYWVVESPERGQRQTACQVLVASSPEKLAADEGDLWDTGKWTTDQNIHVVYGGSPLASRMKCWWKVRLWDRDNAEGPWSAPAFWSMGLLSESDWEGGWIGYDAPYPARAGAPTAITFDGCSWVTLAEGQNLDQGEQVYHGYRGVFTVPEGRAIKHAQALFSSGDQYTLYVNGKEAGRSDGRFWAYKRGSIHALGALIQPGANQFVLKARNWRHSPGIVGKLQIEFETGDPFVATVDSTWKGIANPQGDFAATAYDDTNWPAVRLAAVAGEGPWGALTHGKTASLPCPCLRKAFTARGPIASATLYATALGAYEMRLNGRRVSDEFLRPGWTDFNKRVYYQTYDVTAHVTEGDNALAAYLGHGWYSGYLGWETKAGIYGQHPRLCAQLEVTYADGSTDIIATNSDWKAQHGPIVSSDIYQGETFDATRALTGWDGPGYDDAAWDAVVVDTTPTVPCQAYPGVPVRPIREIAPVSVNEVTPGVFIYDMGQNMVGWVRLRVNGARGTQVRMQFAEILNPDGTLYIENLRGAAQENFYTLAGTGEEVYEPYFSFQGFRYVEMTGHPGTPDLATILGIVAHSDMAQTGRFESPVAMVNQLQHNIEWGQRGNYLEIPTDCPQRDERLGWMGDAQVFVRTGAFNFDIAAFMTKWLVDVVDAQSPEGAFPDVAPRGAHLADGAPAWLDAGVICPWTMYLCYGDTRIIERHYDAMAKSIEYQLGGCTDFIRRDRLNNNYGDWLNAKDDTPKEIVATAFFAYSTQLMARMAQVLHRTADVTKYTNLFNAIRAAFVKTFWKADGTLEGDTQTGYVMAIYFDLLDDAKRQQAGERLVHLIEQRDGHLSTGFMGCSFINLVLSKIGRSDVAYRLLLNDTYPSWGYTIRYGATTMWERWDGWTHDKGFQDPGMNSFNHYSFGAVGDWMYRHVAGIDLAPDAPAYRRFVVRPEVGGDFRFANATYDSIQGEIASAWRANHNSFELSVTVPANCSALVSIPTTYASAITESGGPVSEAAYVTFVSIENGYATYYVDSGHYAFTSPLT